MSLTYHPFENIPAIEALHGSLRKNVPDFERAVSVLSGIGILKAGFRKHGFVKMPLLLMGAALIARAWTGHCPIYEDIEVQNRLKGNDDGSPSAV
ncbi:Protein of unknown function (DUF2892) [Prosthecobacter fusiformis]|uniref:Inner membrane protein YgaP-like transmembrane domain-containing protein n=1 Tax=Prosthecobacter fusiformis TaxID=48464 RepID=A0A4R7S3H0_9BACT|nr:DUF2892 domain-containing protein [Prosthecobacter fusiformis]TDU72814.1 Protein of unknown function (DUF2892) [Prosthecobacter fusiformis]